MIYAFANQRVESRLVKSFNTTGPTSAMPSAPLTHRIPRTTALRSLGGFSNSFANESFFDELAEESALGAGEPTIGTSRACRVTPAVGSCQPHSPRPSGAGGAPSVVVSHARGGRRALHPRAAGVGVDRVGELVRSSSQAPSWLSACAYMPGEPQP